MGRVGPTGPWPRPKAKRSAGALESALRLLSAVESEPPSELRGALAEQLRGRIAFDQPVARTRPNSC